MAPPASDESALVARARTGDADAFEALVVLHQDRVYGVCMRMLRSREEAEEVASQVFVNAHRALPAFRGDSAVSTWLYRIALNLSKNRLRSFARRPPPVSLDAPRGSADGDPVPERPDARAGPEALAEASELSERVESALATLGAEDREIILLRDVEGLSYEEIGRVLEAPEGTVKSRLSRARSGLKEKLAPYLAPAGRERKRPRGVR